MHAPWQYTQKCTFWRCSCFYSPCYILPYTSASAWFFGDPPIGKGSPMWFSVSNRCCLTAPFGNRCSHVDSVDEVATFQRTVCRLSFYADSVRQNDSAVRLTFPSTQSRFWLHPRNKNLGNFLWTGFMTPATAFSPTNRFGADLLEVVVEACLWSAGQISDFGFDVLSL